MSELLNSGGKVRTFNISIEDLADYHYENANRALKDAKGELWMVDSNGNSYQAEKTIYFEMACLQSACKHLESEIYYRGVAILKKYT